MRILRFVAMLLVIVGALNWGLVGVFQYDLVADIFGGMSSGAARFIYALVGLAGLWSVGLLCKCCGCKSGCQSGCKCGSSGCGPGCNCHSKK